VSLLLSARDPVNDMTVERVVPLEGAVPSGAPLPVTLFGVSEYVRNVLLPNLHVEQSFVQGRPHTVLLGDEQGAAAVAAAALREGRL
jgi:hypothetical protein